MNAVSFVAYCGELAGLPRVDAMQRAHEVLFYVGLGEARYRNVETYSTGMRQRIKLAQALVHDPDLLFLDEPTNGMDPKGRDEMLELVRDLAHNKGVNLILSSHLLPDVEYTCDDVVVMDKGKVVAQGPIASLKQPRGQVFELRVKTPNGDLERFLERLRAAGLDCHATDEDVMRVFVPGDARRAPAVRSWRRPTACRSATCGRACRRSRTSSRTRWGRTSVPIHDQGYRRYGGGRAPRGRGWVVIASAGIRGLFAQARVPRPAAAVVAPVLRARGADLRGGQPAAGGVPRAERRDVPPLPRPAEHLRLLRHRLRRRRPHRQRPARQRAADLPVEAADARRVHLRQAARS